MVDIQINTPYTSSTEDLPSAEPPAFISRYFNDLSLDSSGDLNIVTGKEKLAQDILKMLLTVRGSNTLAPNYGTTLEEIIGHPQTLSLTPYISAQLKEDIITGLKALQEGLEHSPLDEQIGALTYFDVTQTEDSVKIDFSILTKSEEALDIHRLIGGQDVATFSI